MITPMTDLVPYYSTCQNAASVRGFLASAVSMKSPGLILRCGAALSPLTRMSLAADTAAQPWGKRLWILFCPLSRAAYCSLHAVMCYRHPTHPLPCSPGAATPLEWTELIPQDHSDNKLDACHAEQGTLLCVVGISIPVLWSCRDNSS